MSDFKDVKKIVVQTGRRGLPGEKGDKGLSAYEVWLNAGNTGTEADFIDSLKSTSIGVYMQDEKPSDNKKYIWIQTNYLSQGGITLWIEDGDQ